jgi:hypothetical protein
VYSAGDGEAGVIDGEGVGALPVRDQVLDVTSAGALCDGLAGERVAAGAGQGAGAGVLDDLLVTD